MIPNDIPAGPIAPRSEAGFLEARVRQLFAERKRYQLPAARSLASLRKSLAVSQETLAGRIGVKQARLSRFERDPDPRLRAIQAYVAALGGTLVLLARLPDRDVHLIAP